MKKSAFYLACALVIGSIAPSAFAQKSTELNNPLPRHMPDKARAARELAGAGGGGGNLTYHNGPVMPNAKVVPIFWGPDWTGSLAGIATSIQNYIKAFGLTGEYNTITQYYQIQNATKTSIQKSDLSAAGSGLFDNTSTPPTNVTDAAIQAEVMKMTNNAPRTDTIYEVFLPSASYSSNGSSTSCGGPNLQYCAYHGNFTSGTLDVKYASMPYPSCGGCQTSGFSVTQNFEHFVSHETREAVTDPDGTGWWDRRGYEADDKCAWSPTPFTDSSVGTNNDGTPYAYQYEWSNANSGCVKTR